MGDITSTLSNFDKFDQGYYDDILQRSNEIQKQISVGQEKLSSFSCLQKDIWAGLFKYNPTLSDKPSPELTTNHAIMEKIMNNPEFQGMREYTKMDELTSAISTISLSEEVMNIVNDVVSSTKATQNKITKQNKNLQEQITQNEFNKDLLQMMQDKMNDTPTDELKKRMQNMQKKINQQQKNIDKTQNDLNDSQQQLQQNLQQQLGAGINNKISQAVDRVSNDVNNITREVNDMLGGKYGIGAPPETTDGLLKKLELSELLKRSKSLRKIIQLAGKMKKVSDARKKKEECEKTSAISSIEHGNNLSKVIPTDLISYYKKETRDMFLKKYANRNLRQYGSKSKDKLGKGPVVVCVDKSGSMNARIDSEYNRIEWAKSLAFALWNLAQKQKRKFYLIEFNDSVTNSKLIDWTQIQDMLNTSNGGGTNFADPLKESVKVIKENKDFKKADIIFITDGDATLRGYEEEFLKEKEKMKLSVYAIQLDGDRCELDKISNKIVKYDGSSNFEIVFDI